MWDPIYSLSTYFYTTLANHKFMPQDINNAEVQPNNPVTGLSRFSKVSIPSHGQWNSEVEAISIYIRDEIINSGFLSSIYLI